MSEYHEPEGELSPEIRDAHRAITSLKEELEAVDWYNQRWAAASDPALRAVLAHNRDEEIEHASMLLEWLRRNMPKWDEKLRTYLFQEADILALEAAADAAETSQGGAAPADAGSGSGDLGIGGARRKA